MICALCRGVSPELSKDMASFPFSPRPLSPRSTTANVGFSNSLVQPRANNTDEANSKVEAHLMRNAGVQPVLQLPDLLPAFRTSASFSEPFSASTPGSPSSQRKILEDGTPASDDLPSDLNVESKLDRECESKTLGSQMAIFPAPLPLSVVS